MADPNHLALARGLPAPHNHRMEYTALVHRLSIPAVLSLVLIWVAPAAETSPETSPETLHQKLLQALHEQRYEEAITIGDALVTASPDDASARYNLACALACGGQTDRALGSLKTAIAKGFEDSRLLARDTDLDNLRKNEEFLTLQKKLRARIGQRYYRPGKDIPGLRSLERDPEGGLRYRLLLAEEEPARPPLLFVWLHPSGGDSNGSIESIAPQIIASGYALLIPVQKNWQGWKSSDGQALMQQSIPDARRATRLDAAAPVLCGYSAGGQKALALWAQAPDQVSGLILDAAYPVTIGPGGKAMLMPLPESSGPSHWLTFTGEKDRGTAFWQRAQPQLQAAGVQLEHHVIPGKGHTWLIKGKQVDHLTTWLQQRRQAIRDLAESDTPATE